MSIRRLTNANYPTVEGVYDEGSQLYYPNYYDDAVLFALTGWDKNTALTKVEIAGFHDGCILFFRDSTELDSDFYWVAYQSGTIFTTTEAELIRQYVRKVPDLTYNDILIIAQEDLTTLPGGNYFYDSANVAYINDVYRLDFTFRFEFTPDDFGTKVFNISYTDPLTGKSNNFNQTIEYVETSNVFNDSSIAARFDEGTLALGDYINPADTRTYTPTAGPSYGGTATVGNKTTFQSHMNILNDTPGSALGWTGKHIVHPYGNHKTVGRTYWTADNSANKGYIDLHADFSFEYDCILSGPQDGTEYSAAGAPTRGLLAQFSDAPNQNENECVCCIFNDETSFDTLTCPDVIINGTTLTKPSGVDTEGPRNYKIFVNYHFNSTLNQGEGELIYYHKYKNDFVSQTTIIPAPPFRAATEDFILNGGYIDGSLQASAYKSLGHFVYRRRLVDPTTEEWMTANCYYFESTLNLGDSWTKTHNLDPDLFGYTNRIMQRYETDGLSRYKSFHTRYAPDYHYTTPPGTAIPSWAGDLGHIPNSGDNDDFIAMLDDRIKPKKVMLAYTGINFGLLFYTTKEQANVAWDNVNYSQPAYYALEHVAALDARGIPWLTWDSCPSDFVLDGGSWPNPAPQNDLIDRHERPTFDWAAIVAPTKTIAMFPVVNDPANNGRILPSLNLGDGAHVTEAGYQLIGDKVYDDHPEILPGT